MQSLRQELQQTVTDWKNSETEKATQDKLMNELRNDLTKEKEKNVLLKTQIALVEDRNKVRFVKFQYDLYGYLYMHIYLMYRSHCKSCLSIALWMSTTPL